MNEQMRPLTVEELRKLANELKSLQFSVKALSERCGGSIQEGWANKLLRAIADFHWAMGSEFARLSPQRISEKRNH